MKNEQYCAEELSSFKYETNREGELPPTWFRREWPFWLGLAIWSLFPSSLTPWFEFAGLPWKSVDLLIFPILGIYLAVPLLRGRRLIYESPRRILFAFLALLVFAAYSLFWAGLSGRQTIGMLYTLFAAAGSAALGYVMIQERSQRQIAHLLWRLSVFVAFVSIVYFAESFFSVGLRSSLAPPDDFGMSRVRGPLFEASTGFILLIPILAFIVQRAVQQRITMLTGIVLGFAVLGTVIGLGSRAGLLLLGIFAVLLTVFSAGPVRIALTVMILTAAAAAGYLVFSKASTDRLLVTLDRREGRISNHLTAWNLIVAKPSQALIGSGYGAYWPWYATEAEVMGGDLYSSGFYSRTLPEGVLIYHSHSTYLVLFLELGLAGVFFSFVLWRDCLAALKNPQWRLLAAGMLVTAFALGFDLFLFRRPTRDLVWWIFLFGTTALCNPEIRTFSRVLHYPRSIPSQIEGAASVN